MINTIRNILIITTFLVFGLLMAHIIECSNSNHKYNKVLGDKEQIDTISLQDSVKQFIKQMNLNHPDIVYAQAVLESGNFQSDLFKNNHNMFGMKEPLSRNTVALGTKNGYAYYKNWQHSIIDYALYQSTYLMDKGHYRSLSRQSYLERLARIYAADPNYITKLNKIINGQYF